MIGEPLGAPAARATPAIVTPDGPRSAASASATSSKRSVSWSVGLPTRVTGRYISENLKTFRNPMTDVRTLEARCRRATAVRGFPRTPRPPDRRAAGSGVGALFDVRPTDLALTRTLMAVRTLPARLTGHARERPSPGAWSSTRRSPC